MSVDDRPSIVETSQILLYLLRGKEPLAIGLAPNVLGCFEPSGESLDRTIQNEFDRTESKFVGALISKHRAELAKFVCGAVNHGGGQEHHKTGRKL